MRRYSLFFPAALLLILVVGAFLSGCTKESERVDGSEETEEETAVRLAKDLFAQEKSKGSDLSDGPCLSDALMDDWVADIAHDPRLPIDDVPENQCPAFGKSARHFVELDEHGEVIRVR